LRLPHRSLAVSILLSFSVLAQPTGFQDPLLDHMVGKWVLDGTIAGRNTTHDIVSEWVLGHQYIRIQEVSREKDARNKAAYEATIFIGRDPKSSEYRCLWLDNTGPWDFTSQGIGHAKRGGDTITFRFGSNDGSSVNTTAMARSRQKRHARLTSLCCHRWTIASKAPRSPAAMRAISAAS
jgi:hypothetical protein